MTDIQRLKEIFAGEAISFDEFSQRLNDRPDILGEYADAQDLAAVSAKFEAEKAALAEREAEYYRNVREQTELLRTIAQKLQQTQGNN